MVNRNIVLVITMALVIALSASSAYAAPITITHMGQPQSQMVVLQAHRSPVFFRVFSDGNISPTEFVIPAGQVLVITEVDWHANSSVAGVPVVMQLNVVNLTDPNASNVVFHSVAVPNSYNADSNHVMTSGIVVASGAKITPACQDTSPLVILRGYLMPAK